MESKNVHYKSEAKQFYIAKTITLIEQAIEQNLPTPHPELGRLGNYSNKTGGRDSEASLVRSRARFL